MQVKITQDEWYPVYSLSSWETDPVAEITNEEFLHITNVFKDFDDVQEKLSDLYDAAKTKRRQEKLLEASKEKAKHDGLSSNF